MMSIAQVRSAGSAGNYYTDKDNYYVLGSMGERWAGRGAEQLGLQGSVDKDVFTRLLEGKLPDGADLSRMAGLVMTVLTVGLVSCTGKSLPRFWYGDFFPTFYACHLTVLGVLAV